MPPDEKTSAVINALRDDARYLENLSSLLLQIYRSMITNGHNDNDGALTTALRQIQAAQTQASRARVALARVEGWF